MHKGTSQEVVIQCKKCRGEFRNSCLFYGHNCAQKSRHWCPICDKLNPKPDVKDKVPSEEEDRLTISSVESLAQNDMQQEPADMDTSRLTDMEIQIKEEPLSQGNNSFTAEQDQVKNDVIANQNETMEEEEEGEPIGKKEKNKFVVDSDWYVCTDCQPCKLLRYSDGSLRKHTEITEEGKGHFQINPLISYNGFSVEIDDLTNNPNYREYINHLLQEMGKSPKGKRTKP